MVDLHGRVKKKIFQVASAVASTSMSIGDGAVEVNFGVGYTDGRGADVLVGVKLVTVDSYSDAIDFHLIGSHCAYKVCVVGDFATRRYMVWVPVDDGRGRDERCFETPWAQCVQVRW